MKLVSFIVMLGVLVQVSAQDSSVEQSLDVDEAVRIALDNNLSLQRSALDLSGKQRTADRSWNTLIPSLSASAQVSHPTSITGAIPADVWTPGFQVSASLTLSAATIEQIKKARADYEAGTLTFEQARQELELQVRKLFYQLILLDANRALAARSLESAQARYEQSAALARAGQASHLDELSARVDRENQKPTLRNAETVYENTVDSFKALLGIPRERSITLSGTLDYAGDPNRITQAARSESLESAVLLKSIETLEIQRRAAWNGAYIPSLRLSWNSTTIYSNDTWNDNAGSFSVSLGINIDNFLPWSTAKTQIDDLNDRMSAAQMQLAESQQNQESRIAQYRRTIEKSIETIEALKLNVELALTTYELYEDAYRKGAADYQRLRDAGDSLLQAQNQVQQEQYNLIAAVLDMEKELNVPLGTVK
ncbi:MAG: TolC family protein [Treponema sp.]|jgi:outer membrane protein TolC|nr:TolC family protein [Treponema sp.]